MYKYKISKKKYFFSLKTTISALLVAVFFLVNTGEINAQILIGPKVGARMSWLQYENFAEDLYKKKAVFGYAAGFTTVFKVQKRFLLQLDVMYTQKGKKLDGVLDPSFQNYARYHYISTPVVYKLNFKASIGDRVFQWYLGAGPSVDFWIGGKGKLKSVELREDNIEELDYKVLFDEVPSRSGTGILYVEQPNKVQVGLILSAGIVLEPAQGQSVMIDLRYEWGHSYMANEKGRFADVVADKDDLVARNQAVQVSVAYVFDIINKGKKEKKMYYEN